jgi:predicted transcriptional regulator YdeE
METITQDKDIIVFYITATSFPNGVLEAHQKLHSLIHFSTERKYFGLSRPENGGGITYRAAAEQLESGEAEKLNLDTIVLKKGRYLSLTVNDYMKDIPGIGKAFQEILAQPGLDPQGYCVEWYLSDKDVQCMVRLA